MKEIALNEYRADVENLIRYIPWFEEKAGKSVSSIYNGDGLNKSSIGFPVYESTLLSFVKEAMDTGLMDSNYHYVYSENSIKDTEDEKKAIEEADLKGAYVLTGILSRYVYGGQTKGTLWTVATEEGIFLAVLKKMKELLDIWDHPLA